MPRAEVALTVEVYTALSSSGWAARGVATRDLARDGWGRLILPATHVKGRLRHACLQVARTLGLPGCGAGRAHAPAEAGECPLCALFGAPGYAGTLRWRDLPYRTPGPLGAEESPGDHVPPSPAVVRGGLALSRQRDIAAGSAYWRPTTPPLSEQPLQFGHPAAITGTVAVAGQLQLLLAGCRLVTSLGQGRSRGLGWATVQATALLDGVPLQADPHALAVLRLNGSTMSGEVAP